MLARPNLKYRVAFDRPHPGQDDYGNETEGWDEQFETRAAFLWLRGSEPVIAARLIGVQPVVVTIRKSSESDAISTDWRMRHLDGEEYNIRTIVPTDDGLYFELTCESGVAI